MKNGIMKRDSLPAHRRDELQKEKQGFELVTFEGEVKTPARKVVDFGKAVLVDWERHEEKRTKIVVSIVTAFWWSVLMLVVGAVFGISGK